MFLIYIEQTTIDTAKRDSMIRWYNPVKFDVGLENRKAINGIEIKPQLNTI